MFLAEELSQKCGMGYTKLIVVTGPPPPSHRCQYLWYPSPHRGGATVVKVGKTLARGVGGERREVEGGGGERDRGELR